jgi:hypothetical protein
MLGDGVWRWLALVVVIVLVPYTCSLTESCVAMPEAVIVAVVAACVAMMVVVVYA